MITRRTLISSTSSLVSLAVIGGAAAQALTENVAARLQRDLDAAVRPGSRTRLEVLRLTPSTGIGVKVFGAVVAMYWPPGYRSRPVEGVGADEEEAYRVLLAKVIETFRAPNPDGFV